MPGFIDFHLSVSVDGHATDDEDIIVLSGHIQLMFISLFSYFDFVTHPVHIFVWTCMSQSCECTQSSSALGSLKQCCQHFPNIFYRSCIMDLFHS